MLWFKTIAFSYVCPVCSREGMAYKTLKRRSERAAAELNEQNSHERGLGHFDCGVCGLFRLSTNLPDGWQSLSPFISRIVTPVQYIHIGQSRWKTRIEGCSWYTHRGIGRDIAGARSLFAEQLRASEELLPLHEKDRIELSVTYEIIERFNAQYNRKLRLKLQTQHPLHTIDGGW